MGKRPIYGEKCGVMGCTLPYLHAGMHETALLCKRRRENSNFTDMKDFRATLRNSPIVDRNDVKISHSEIEIELLKSKLKWLKKQIDDFCVLLNVQ